MLHGTDVERKDVFTKLHGVTYNMVKLGHATVKRSTQKRLVGCKGCLFTVQEGRDVMRNEGQGV